jgi:hypothetical protein
VTAGVHHRQALASGGGHDVESAAHLHGRRSGEDIAAALGQRGHPHQHVDDRSSFGWDPDSVPDPQDPATFERSRLDWTEPDKDRHADLLAWYRSLIALRRRIPALTDPRLGRVETECDPAAGWLVVRRGPVVVAANLGHTEWAFPAGPDAELLAASDDRIEAAEHGPILPPDTVAVLATKGPSPR